MKTDCSTLTIFGKCSITKGHTDESLAGEQSCFLQELRIKVFFFPAEKLLRKEKSWEKRIAQRHGSISV